MGGCCSSKVSTRWFNAYEKDMGSLEGKKIAITGTTSGVGFCAALTCVKKGAEVFALNRPSKRAEDSLDKIRAAVPNGKITAIECDLQSFASVRRGAQELNAKCAAGGLDVLSLNAGVMGQANRATEDGFDVQMQTNAIAGFLLTKDVMPSLKRALELKGHSRVVAQTSSARHGTGGPQGPLEAKYLGKNGPELGPDANPGADTRYHHSKLATLVFSHALHNKFKAANLKITSTCATPGYATTSLFANADHHPFPTWIPQCVVTNVIGQQTAEDATMPLLDAMFKPDAEGMVLYSPSMGLMSEMRGPVKVYPAKPTDLNFHAGSEEMLWSLCEKAIGEPFTL